MKKKIRKNVEIKIINTKVRMLAYVYVDSDKIFEKVRLFEQISPCNL